MHFTTSGESIIFSYLQFILFVIYKTIAQYFQTIIKCKQKIQNVNKLQLI